MLEAAGEVHARGGLGPRREPALALLALEPVEERGQVRQLALDAALERAPTARDLARCGDVALLDRGEQLLQAVAVLAEPDHAESRLRHGGDHERPRGEQQVHALRHDQLADVGHDPVARRVEHPQRGGGALVAAPARGGRALQPVRQRTQPGDGLVVRAGPELVDVHAGGPEPRAVGQRRVVERRPQALARVTRSHQHAGGTVEALARQRQEALRVRLDRVLERAPVDLDRVPQPRPRQDDRPHDEVVRQRGLGGDARGHVAHGADVGGEVVLQLGIGQVLEGLGVEALVAVGDVHGQDAPDRRRVDRAAHRLAQHLDLELATVPRCRRRPPTAARARRGPGTGGAPRGPGGPSPARGWRCRRCCPCRAAGSRGIRGS